MRKRPNVIFIVMDALRAKNLGCYGYNKETSQNIDNLAKRGVLFKNAFSTNNSTSPSFLSILSGRHLLKKDQNTFLYNENEINSFFNSGGIFLQEILKKRGYKTFCLNELYNWQKRGFDYHWEDSDEKTRDESAKIKESYAFKLGKEIFYFLSIKYPFYYFTSLKLKKQKVGRDDRRVTDEAIEIIKRNKENNFFIRIDYSNTHMPYYSPDEFEMKFIAEKKGERLLDKLTKENSTERLRALCRAYFPSNITLGEVIAKYDGAIAYDDYLIGKIIKTLIEEEIYDNTIIVFFSDHGESLGEHNIYVDHFGLYDTTMRVPLILSGPRIPENKEIESLVQLEDVTPTILNILGINYSPLDFDGESLLPLLLGEKEKIRDNILLEEVFNLRRIGVRNEKYKYIKVLSNQTEKKKEPELYDLEGDPNEKENIINENKKVAEEMEVVLRNLIKNINKANEKRRLAKILKKSQSL